MAVILNEKGNEEPRHSCYRELPGELAYSFWGIADAERRKIKRGLIARCSCGALWRTRAGLSGNTVWTFPSPYNYWKYRNLGKEVDA